MYCFSYFKTESEALYLAISEDGRSWKDVNCGNALLKGTKSNKVIRDPFILKGEDGLYRLLFTDGWASKNIIYSESSDLVNWSEQRIIPVMENIEGANNSWAPEAIYDEKSGFYYIYWSSTIDKSNLKKRDHRIWYCKTKDFKEFSDSKVFYDPGYSVIDASIIKQDKGYLMAFKDERGENKPDTPYKAMRMLKIKDLENIEEKPSPLVTGPLTEGPSLIKDDHGNILMYYDYFEEDRYGLSISRDGINWEKEESLLHINKARHGSIFKIGKSEYDRLIKYSM